MKICLLSHQASFIYGGEIVSMGMAKGISSEWKMHFAMPKGIYADRANLDFTVHEIPSIEFSRDIRSLWRFLAAWIATNERLRDLIQKEDFKILHATSLKSMVYAWMLGFKGRIPVVWHHHDIMAGNFMNSLWLRLIALGADKIIVVSEAAKDSLVEAGVQGNKIKVIRNGLDSQQWKVKSIQEENKRINIGVVGEISPRKGTDWLPQILRSLDEDKIENLKITIVGDSLSDVEFGARMQAELSLWVEKGIVEFVGRQENISEWMQRFDIVLVPSRQDPFPTVIMEANFSGTPVVACPNGGIPEMIKDGETGFLCGSVAEMVQKIELLMDDRKMLANLSEAARKFAESDFSLQKMATDVESIYAEIIQTQK